MPKCTQLVSGGCRVYASLEEQTWICPPTLPEVSDKGTLKQIINSQPFISQIKALRPREGKSHGSKQTWLEPGLLTLYLAFPHLELPPTKLSPDLGARGLGKCPHSGCVTRKWACAEPQEMVAHLGGIT